MFNLLIGWAGPKCDNHYSAGTKRAIISVKNQWSEKDVTQQCDYIDQCNILLNIIVLRGI